MLLVTQRSSGDIAEALSYSQLWRSLQAVEWRHAKRVAKSSARRFGWFTFRRSTFDP
jgi:hypothetical protein